MKCLLPILLFLHPLIAVAQMSVGSSTIHPSAMFQLKDTSLGILIPRMDAVTRAGIASPAKGLMVYDSSVNQFYYYNGTAWGAVGSDNLGNHTATQNLNLGSNKLTGNSGTAGISIDASGNVGIGTTTPGTSLDIAGGLTTRQNAVAISSYNATTGYTATIPANVSQVSLTGTANPSLATSITVMPPTPAGAGQQLSVFNNASGGVAASLNGYIIPAGQLLTFRSTGTTGASFLPDGTPDKGVRIFNSVVTSAASLPTDFLVEFNGCGSNYYTLPVAGEWPAGTIYFSLNWSPCATAISLTAGFLTLPYVPASGQYYYNAMLISDGSRWIPFYAP